MSLSIYLILLLNVTNAWPLKKLIEESSKAFIRCADLDFTIINEDFGNKTK